MRAARATGDGRALGLDQVCTSFRTRRHGVRHRATAYVGATACECSCIVVLITGNDPSTPVAEKFLYFLPKMGCVVNTEFGVDLSRTRYLVDAPVAAATLEEAHERLEVRNSS